MKVRSLYHKDYLFPVLTGSLLLHGLVMGTSGWVEFSPDYHVERSPSSMEIVMVTQPPEVPEKKAEEAAPVFSVEEEAPDKTPEKLETVEKETETPPEEARPSEEEPMPEALSPPDQGALVPPVPDEVKNKAPAYPYVARQRGWEGTVLLSVRVSADGRAGQVEIRESSGKKILDQAAVRAVREWKFEPAHLGGVSMVSTVEIPVRFVLE